MKLLPALCAFTLLAASLGQAESRKLAFSRGSAIFVSGLDGKNSQSIGKGSWPDISPDGTHVAFNTEAAKTPDRQIAVTDVTTKKTTLFSGVPSSNCHSPVWSPDGSQILFYIYVDNDWQVGLINADGTGFRYVMKAAANSRSYWSAAWAADGKSFYCQDLDTIFRIGLDGNIQRKWKLHDLVPHGGFSSGTHLAPSADGKSLLFDVDMDEQVTIKDWDGPPPAIWKFDFASGKATRVTPEKLFAWQPCWLANDEILFVTAKDGVKKISIYRQKLDGSGLTRVVPNAVMPSVSR